MERLPEMLTEASDSPPPPTFTVAELVRTEDRRRRRRRHLAGWGTAAGVAAAVGVGVLAVPAGTTHHTDTAGPDVPSTSPHRSPTQRPSPSRSPGGAVTEPPEHATKRLYSATIDALRQVAPGVTFSWVELYYQRHDAPFTYYSSQGGYKSAGILNDRAGKSYLFIDLGPGRGESEPTCQHAQGHCTLRHLADGTVLAVQVMHRDNGVVWYAVGARRPDGTRVDLIEENYSEADQPAGKHAHPYAQRAEPTLSTDELGTIARALTVYPNRYPGEGLPTSSGTRPAAGAAGNPTG